ncbi:transcriptional regulator [Gramella sp. KN1008]|uniref:winged helix-turn-helix domain-containing protein n=1 Tax=Gramella sp. KN1008 TaxID=2529298 RepID=UPI00103FAB4B|nr:transcriptional regulator [Gramella sp. KN1008]TBW28293.1 transcriptional regulator [Gramella sp. KN1008]
MKNIISNINKAFDHRVRLGIMSVLMVNEYADFKTLKELLGVTDGNIASHTKALEKQKYIKVEKSFIDRKPNTRYLATQNGRKAFQAHLDALEKLLNKDINIDNTDK